MGRILCVCDSRGRYLEDALLDIQGDHGRVDVIFYSGATLGSLKTKIRAYTRCHVVQAAYIMAGVNNITWRDPVTRKCYLKYHTPPELSDSIMDEIEELLRYCVSTCGLRDVIMVPITGLHLNQYNNFPSWHPEQWVINWGLMDLNTNIVTMNAACGFSTPLTHHYVHKSTGRNRRMRHHYTRLWDGLHPRGDTLYRWAESLLEAMRRNGHH